ncbi:MAG: hypothetical protein AB7H77_05275 [Bdellovibrionales bacterium]
MRTTSDTKDSRKLASVLTGRYGALALTRAAGAAAAAERRGNREETTMWKNVMADLRQEIAAAG